MKGIVFNFLEEFIRDRWGKEAFDRIARECNLGSNHRYDGLRSYPDSDFVMIVRCASEMVNQPEADILRAFGAYCFPKLAAKVPRYVATHHDPKVFLKTVDGIIHVEVRRLFSEAETPRFEYEDPGPGRLKIRYHSKRKLCHLMEGLLQGVGDFFHSPIQHRQNCCLHEGAEYCEFDLKFVK